MMMPPPQLNIVQSEPQGKTAKQEPLATTNFFAFFHSGKREYQRTGSASSQNVEQSPDNSNDPLNIHLDISLRLPDELPALQQSTSTQVEAALPLLSRALEQQESITISGTPVVITDETLVGSTQASMAFFSLQSGEFPHGLESSASLGAIDPGGDPNAPPNPGAITLNCETTPNHWLTDAEKQSPGWFSDVNWSDDDNDGWSPASTKTTTADPSATYTPDKDDTNLIPNGDPDLRRFVVTVIAPDIFQDYDYSFTLTFGSTVRVYQENTKADPIESGKVFHTSELSNILPGVSIKSKTLWLEGYAASAAFKDVTLKAEYTPAANTVPIPMLKPTDEAKVTVFWVGQRGIFSGDQQADDDQKNSTSTTKYSNDENGKISWDLPRYIGWETIPPPDKDAGEYCQYFRDCMEVQGSILPPRDAQNSVYYGWTKDPNNPTAPPSPMPAPLVKFDVRREVYTSGWERIDGLWSLNMPSGVDFRTWSDDYSNPATIGKVEIPTIENHLYFNDAPGHKDKVVNNNMVVVDYKQSYDNFRNWITVEIYGVKFMCSDYYKWHSQILLKPKPNTNFLTRAKDQYQKLGDGWIDVLLAPDTATANW